MFYGLFTELMIDFYYLSSKYFDADNVKNSRPLWTASNSVAESVLQVKVIMVTSSCWWIYDGDWFQMLVAESLCWRFFSLCWWFSKSFTNILNRSPTSQTCHQHIWSPWSVTNIDVTVIEPADRRQSDPFLTIFDHKMLKWW